MTSSPENGSNSKRPMNRWLWTGGAGVSAALLLALVFLPPGSGEVEGPTFVARQGPLEITLSENGNVEALRAQEIRSEMQGRTTILSIVEEGYRVTEEDVENGMILVELDSSDLEDRLTRQEITYQNAYSSLTEARENYEIQLSNNESNIHDAELSLRFAELNLTQFLGDAVGYDVLAKIEDRMAPVEEEYASAQPAGLQYASADFDPTEVPIEELDVDDIPEVELDFDYRAYLDDDRLGGESQQRLRNLTSNITLAREELAQAEERYGWTEELAERGFVTPNDVEQDRLTVQRRAIQLQAAETSRELYTSFEFPRELARLISDYEQYERRLDRTKRQAAARTAQAEATLRSAQSTYELEARRLTDYEQQIASSVIRAERPGIVVYGTDSSDIIEEGAEVRERQEILSIPDMREMAVEVQIHESLVNRVRQGLPARIVADSFPEETLLGEVSRVALVPDSGNWRRNPDLRIFPTMVSVEGQHEWLRPGMTAQVEILVDRLDNVVHVPLPSIVTHNNERYVYVVDRGRTELRLVEIGRYNDRYIEIRSGLAEGEVVLERPPRPDGAMMDDNGGRDENGGGQNLSDAFASAAEW